MTVDPAPGSLLVGLISDTHGWLDPRAVAAFAAEGKLERIVHAGDIGSEHVLYELETIAPVTAVLGNCDFTLPGFELDMFARVTVGGATIAVVHDRHKFAQHPDDDIIVYGHSHKPSVRAEHGILY